jgi:phage terminase large subunit-like protein
MGMSLAKRVALLPQEQRGEFLAQLPDQALEEIARGEWWWTSRPEQVPPPGVWHLFLYLAGRGTGKTRAGAEWLIQRVIDHPVDRSGAATEHLVIAETVSDARSICVEGPSGLLRVLDRRGFEQVVNRYKGLRLNQYHYTKSPKPRIEIGEYGTKIYFEGADKPDVGRGYTAASGWLDEIIKWPYPKEAWIEGIMPSMRADLVNDHPRVFVTTTPKPFDLLFDWVNRKDGSVQVSRGSTYDNADNLSEHTIRELRLRYEGTTIGRQELYGELLEAFEGTLFRQSDIDATRVNRLPEGIMHIALGVDPSLTGEDAEMGCVVVARSRNGDLYVIADETIQATGKEAAEHCWRVFEQYECDTLVYENTQGKEWLDQVMRDAFDKLREEENLFYDLTLPPMKGIDSKRGKRLRAQPIAQRMEQKRIHHVGIFKTLEKQMVTWVPEVTARTHRNSPDRLDAMVHASWFLMNFDKRRSHIASPASLTNRMPRSMGLQMPIPDLAHLSIVRRSA